MRYPHHVKLCLSSPPLKLGAVGENEQILLAQAREAAQSGHDLWVCPELALTGYTLGDLFHQRVLMSAVEASLQAFQRASRAWPWLTLVVGGPLPHRQQLYNVAYVIRSGEILGAVPKSILPNHQEFYEARWFASWAWDREIEWTTFGRASGESAYPLGLQVFEIPLPTEGLQGKVEDYAYARLDGRSGPGPNPTDPTDPAESVQAAEGRVRQETYRLGIEICEDLWAPLPPSTRLALAGAEVLVNLSASPALVSKADYRQQLVAQQSARLHAAYAYTSSGPWESSTDLVFSSHRLLAQNGQILKEDRRMGFHRADQRPLSALIDLVPLRQDRLENAGFNGQQREALSQTGLWLNDQALKRLFEAMKRSAHADHPSPIDPALEILPDQGAYTVANPPFPFIPAADKQAERFEEMLDIQALGLARRILQVQTHQVVLGISGGLDSTLALLVADRALDRLELNPDGLLCYTMPGFGTTDQTYENACQLVRALHGTLQEISIVPAVKQHFLDLNHPLDRHDLTYENSQARERTQLLMDLAGQAGTFVVGTGDLSELALGWCTYNGDHMSMYGVNAAVPKTLVSHLVAHCAKQARAEGRTALATVLDQILATPISPELLPPDEAGQIKQLTEETTGPYALHDFFLFHTLRYGRTPAEVFFLAQQAFSQCECSYSPEVIHHWLGVFYRRFFSQQFKRSCLPDGPKIGSVSLSPRGDWRMPSDASSALWLNAWAACRP